MNPRGKQAKAKSGSLPVSDQDWQQSIYNELHRLAQHALRHEAAGHSLQPTMLVDDAYLYLLRQRNVDLADRSQVMAVGAQFIRRILVDHARRRKAEKRGGEAGRGVPLHISIVDHANSIDVVDLHEALETLAAQNDRAAQVVELKFFGGSTGQEIADQLEVSLQTVNNDWRFAKAWLYSVLDGDSVGNEANE